MPNRRPGWARPSARVAADAGITNVSLVTADWLSAEGVTGDVVMNVDVAYFVEDMASFIRKLDAAARRRVIISLWVVPPPNRHAALFRTVFGEDQVLVPGHEDVVAVAREQAHRARGAAAAGGLLVARRRPRARHARGRNRVRNRDAQPADRAAAAARVDAHLDELFERVGDDYEPNWVHDGVGVLVTWETTRPASGGR